MTTRHANARYSGGRAGPPHPGDDAPASNSSYLATGHMFRELTSLFRELFFFIIIICPGDFIHYTKVDMPIEEDSLRARANFATVSYVALRSVVRYAS